jgi:recombination protein RecA
MAKKNLVASTEVAAVPNLDKVKALLTKFHHPQRLSFLRTGLHAFDLAIGSGIPLGRVIEIFGAEAGGKSLLAWLIVRSFQKAGGIAIFDDVEAKTPVDFIQKLGINTEELVYYKHNTVEQVAEDLRIAVGELRAVTDVPIVYVIDSIAGLTADQEWDEDKDTGVLTPSENKQPARRAAALSKFFAQNTLYLSDNNVTLICVNQLREKIGILFGKKSDAPGGRALKHAASVRVELSRGAKVKTGDDITSVGSHINVVKNQVAEPFRKTELKINMGGGYDEFGGLDNILILAKRITLKGTKEYIVGEDTISRKDLAEYTKLHPELLNAWL